SARQSAQMITSSRTCDSKLIRFPISNQSASVICADCRALSQATTGASELELKRMFHANNPRLLRSGILVDANEFMLQLSEEVRRAANPRRRIFYTVEMLSDWLDPVLTPVEKVAVQELLSGAPLFRLSPKSEGEEPPETHPRLS
ncbi:MAG: hypothetical protein AAFX94_01720, partial [Myxococcota bacterium]